MNKSDVSISNRTSDLVLDAYTKRAAILVQIDSLERDSVDIHANTDSIHSLQQQYNNMVHHISQLQHRPLSDPIDALPLELWTKIIEQAVNEYDPVDQLLDLTTISKAWRSALISLPTLWTSIVLDPAKGDCLAKAYVSIALSGACELNVRIHVSFNAWREMSSIILNECGRIGSLRINPAYRYEGLRILKDFSELPVLRILHLPRGTKPSHEVRLWRALKFDQMPSLELIEGPSPEIHEQSWLRFITFYYTRVDVVQQDMVEAWAKLPNLRTLRVTEEAETFKGLPEKPRSLLLSVRVLMYEGRFVDRFLKWMGPNLTELYTGAANPRDILMSLARFHRLSTLELRTFTEVGHSSGIDLRASLPTLRSVKKLNFSSTGDGWREAKNITELLDNLELLYQDFITSLPSVEFLTVYNSLLTESSCSYLASLANLRHLDFYECDLYIAADPYPAISLMNLESIKWNGKLDPEALLSSIAAPRLHTVFLESTRLGDTFDAEIEVDIPRNTIPEKVCLKVICLRVLFNQAVLWNLGVQANLRELDIWTCYNGQISSGDILEQILMRPADFPLLEKITLADEFFEWDLLILMLERKNIYARSGVVPIKTIVIDQALGYHLLYPITALLRGVFPERDANVTYSLEAIGRRIWDESSTGCELCCYTFRPCATATEPSRDRVIGVENKNRNYTAASECLMAEPPLRPDVAEWLAAKNERRRSFARSRQEAERRFVRVNMCANNKSRHGVVPFTPVIITGWSLGTGHAFDGSARELGE